MSVSISSTSSTPVWKGTSVSTTRGGQSRRAVMSAPAAPHSAASRAQSRYTGSRAQSTAKAAAAAYHGRTLGFWVRMILLMQFLLFRGALARAPCTLHHKTFCGKRKRFMNCLQLGN